MSKKCLPTASQNGDAAGVVHHAAHLRDHQRVERPHVLGHEQEPRQRQQPAVAVAAVVGRQEQAADLARPVVLGHQVQRLDLLPHAEEFRLVDARLDPVGVKRLEPADLRDDPARPCYRAGVDVFHHEQVSFGPRLVAHLGEAPLRFVDAPAQDVRVARQRRETLAGEVREGEDGVEILGSDGTNDDHVQSLPSNRASTSSRTVHTASTSWTASLRRPAGGSASGRVSTRPRRRSRRL